MTDMRIGLFADPYLPRLDGGAFAIAGLRHGLEAAGHEVFVITTRRPGAGRFYREHPNVLALPSLPGVYPGLRTLVPWPHLKQVEQLNLDLVHIHTTFAIGLLGGRLAQREKLPLVVTWHLDPTLSDDYPLMSLAAIGAEGKVRRFIRHPSAVARNKLLALPHLGDKAWRYRTVIQAMDYMNSQSDGVIVPSAKVARDFMNSPYEYPLEIIPTGVDPRPPVENRADIRRRYGLSPKALVYVMASRLIKEKNQRLTIEAFARLKQPDSYLLLMGDGPDSKHLHKLARSLGVAERVIFTGTLARSAVRDTMAACDIFLNVSLRETQGLVINEASHAGLPLIVCEADINPCITPKTALVVPATVPAIAKAMKKLAGDPALRRRLGAEARKTAVKTTLDTQAAATLKLYQKAVRANQ